MFDWKYTSGVKESAAKLKEKGFKVLGCPTLHIYNAAWMHVEASEKNVREVSADVHELDLEGVCLTTWEFGCFGAVDTAMPAVKACSAIMDDPANAPGLLSGWEGESQEWARLLGVELEKVGGVFAFSGRRSSLKSRLLLYSNPFLAWMHHGDELTGELGDKALAIVEKAIFRAQNEAEKGPALFIRGAIEFVRMAESARREYAAGRPERAISVLAPTRYLFDSLETIAKRTRDRIGGSSADIERCRAAKQHVEVVIKRVRDYGNGELGYLPAWEIITNPRFMPHDQGCWWLINKWANQ